MSTGTVADIPDDELLRRVMRGIGMQARVRGRPLWAVVMDRFALGSTYAQQLCLRFELDPDELVK